MNKLAVTLLFVTVTAGFASTIQFTGLPGNYQYGTYNGYAFATIDGVSNQQLICDDYDHTTYVPSGPMDFTLSTLNGAAPLASARFVDPQNTAATIAKYEEAAILLDGLRQTGKGSLLDLTADYQYALWELFTPTVTLPNATAQTLLNDAAASVKQGGAANQAIYSELMVYTPKAAYSSNQEFLQLAPAPVGIGSTKDSSSTPTPEPRAELLVGMGLVAIGWAARRGLLKRNALLVAAHDRG